MIDGLWVIIFYVTVNCLELQNLRQEKELADSEIASLELEKNAIRKVSSRVTTMVIRCRIVVTSLCQFFTCLLFIVPDDSKGITRTCVNERRHRGQTARTFDL